MQLETVGPEHVRVAIVRPRGVPADRRLPVIDSAYGGPHASMVQQSATTYARMQWIADATGAAVVAIDARGTPHRGRAWERALAGKLGAVPLEGHVATLQAIGAAHPELDVSRVGVYGWSFGGYFAAMAVLARPDVYVAGVAGAPPVDWRDYDTAYTERYLGLPDDDAAAYDAASLLTMAKDAAAKGLPARKLLIVHGTADDNVWFLNALKLVDALERAHRPFEFLAARRDDAHAARPRADGRSVAPYRPSAAERPAPGHVDQGAAGRSGTCVAAAFDAVAPCVAGT